MVTWDIYKERLKNFKTAVMQQAARGSNHLWSNFCDLMHELCGGGVQVNDLDYVEVSAQMVFGHCFTTCVLAYARCVCVHMCYRRRRISYMGKL